VDLSSRPAQANSSQDPISKTMAGGVAQVVECLPSKWEALNSDPNTEKKKKENQKSFMSLCPDTETALATNAH
jgi:hypothetical protein